MKKSFLLTSLVMLITLTMQAQTDVKTVPPAPELEFVVQLNVNISGAYSVGETPHMAAVWSFPSRVALSRVPC